MNVGLKPDATMACSARACRGIEGRNEPFLPVAARVITVTRMGALLDKLERDATARRVAFFVLLIVYAVVVLAVQTPALVGDEWRYLWYAENLLRGYYSPPEFVFLWNGPAYPLMLVPAVALGVPLVFVKLGNVVLMGVALYYFFALVRGFTHLRGALVAVGALVLYLPVLGFLPFVYTEVTSFALVVLFSYGLFGYLTQGTERRAWLAGLSLGWLCLTKIVFGPLMLLGTLLSLVLLAFRRGVLQRRLSRVFVTAFAVTLPYLVYSYGVTGRPLYWGSGGGSTIYWMSNPHPGQLGDWFHQEEVRENPELARDHWEFIERIGKLEGRELSNPEDKDQVARYLSDLSGVQADLAFRERAYQNIRRHPEAYLKNWLCNVSRLMVDYPYTARPYGVLNFLQGLANLSSFALALLALRRLVRTRSPWLPIGAVLGSLLFAYLGMLSLVSASGRFFVPVAPLCVGLGALAFAPTLGRREGGGSP